MTAVIETHNLSKRYPRKIALDKLNLTVYPGEIFGYLGPNGAGKSTTIRLLLDLIRPSEGQARIFGLDAQQHSVEVKRYIGNLPSELRLWEHLSGVQVLHYLSGLRPGSDLNYAYELAERLDLNLRVRVGDYSTGNRRKLGLVQALMHRPALLILDEPTTGLDPLVQQTFYELMREIRDDGRTVFLSSHTLSEVDEICDRVGILRDGRLQAVERISTLKLVQYRWLTLVTKAEATLADWEVLPCVSDVSRVAQGIQMRVTGSMDAVIKLAAQYEIDDLRIQEPTLEEIFLAYYGTAHD